MKPNPLDFFALLGRLEYAESRLEDDALFYEVVRESILLMDLTCLELSEVFGVSAASIRRWLKEKNSPLPTARPQIYAWLISRLCTRHSRESREATRRPK